MEYGIAITPKTMTIENSPSTSEIDVFVDLETFTDFCLNHILKELLLFCSSCRIRGQEQLMSSLASTWKKCLIK